MQSRQRVTQRQIERAQYAGSRWRDMAERRAEVVRKLKAGGPEAADTPDRVQRWRAREEAKRIAYARAGVTSACFRERRVGPTLDLDEFAPNEAAQLAGRSVGRIVAVDGRGNVIDGFATGFLISSSLLLTNHHVFAEASEVTGCGVQFGYELQRDRSLAAGVVFALDPGQFFYADEELDFAIVGVATRAFNGQTLSELGSLPLIPVNGKILVGQAISIIQHPDGGPKKYGVRDNELLMAPADTDLFLEYTTDTLPGSSGSPAFNKDWEVVALHHSGVPEIRNGEIMTIRGTPWTSDMPDSDIHWVANEGVRVSRICAHLSGAQVSPAQQPALAALVRSFADDLSEMPAIKSQREEGAMTVPGTGTTIIVNGTANFYMGVPAPADQRSVVAPPLPPALEKKLVFDPHYDQRGGYDLNFLGPAVPVPGVAANRAGEILEDNGNPLVLDYHHYSLVMNETRRLAMWAAVNADYNAAKRRKSRDEFGDDTWVADPRIAGILQIQDAELYEPAKKFDRGHIIRRDDTAWGDTEQEEIFANSDSFHWTNCTPQHERFNRDKFGFHGLWGQLENHIAGQAQNTENLMCIFAGPVLDNVNDIRHDFGFGETLIPRRFWKVVIVAENARTPEAKLEAFGFVMNQTQSITAFGIERFDVGEFDTFQKTLQEITDMTGVTFAASLHAVDNGAGLPEESRRRPLRSATEVRSRRARV